MIWFDLIWKINEWFWINLKCNDFILWHCQEIIFVYSNNDAVHNYVFVTADSDTRSKGLRHLKNNGCVFYIGSIHVAIDSNNNYEIGSIYLNL